MKSLSIFILSSFLVVIVPFSMVTAQTEIQCGSKIDGEFIQGGVDGSHNYTIPLAPGDKLKISGETIGDYLEFGITLDAPTTGRVTRTGPGLARFHYGDPVIETGILSERGNYKIYIESNGPGLYTLLIGCTLRDGTVINPGDTMPDPPPTSASITVPSVSTSSMPDFSAAQNTPLTPGTPVFGAVSPGGTELFSYTLDAEGGSLLDLTFSKLSGNLNLSFVVLTSDNQVLFQTNLVNLTELKTSLTIPDAGTYTIGVFRVDLLPPAVPEATAFQVQGTLNP
jgi:hypothetical protein